MVANLHHQKDLNKDLLPYICTIQQNQTNSVCGKVKKKMEKLIFIPSYKFMIVMI